MKYGDHAAKDRGELGNRVVWASIHVNMLWRDNSAALEDNSAALEGRTFSAFIAFYLLAFYIYLYDTFKKFNHGICRK